MANYRVHRVFEQIPSILGMDLVRKGEKWEGPYYLNGDRHAFRREKLKVVKWKGQIWLFEEGGDAMSLTTWLVKNGRATDYWDAIKLLEGDRAPVMYDARVREKEKIVKYVPIDALLGAKAYDLALSPLFRYMCRLFPEKRVREVWDMYNVTANSKHGTVFWYVNESGRICHDKICWYGADGHRIKTLPMSRQYRIGDGYTENPLFGSNLPGEVKGIVESEKTCLYASCYYGGIWLATGGKGNIHEANGVPLYPDRDGEAEWAKFGECVKWYEGWDACGSHSDLGDMIEYLVKKEKGLI